MVRPGQRIDRRWLAGCLVLAVVLRFFRIGHQSLWVDEMISLELATWANGAEFWRGLLQDIHGPWGSMLLHGWVELAVAGERLLATACDLSEGGIGLSLAAPHPAPGARVETEFALPGFDVPLAVSARVACRTPSPEWPGQGAAGRPVRPASGGPNGMAVLPSPVPAAYGSSAALQQARKEPRPRASAWGGHEKTPAVRPGSEAEAGGGRTRLGEDQSSSLSLANFAAAISVRLRPDASEMPALAASWE